LQLSGIMKHAGRVIGFLILPDALTGRCVPGGSQFHRLSPIFAIMTPSYGALSLGCRRKIRKPMTRPACFIMPDSCKARLLLYYGTADNNVHLTMRCS